MQVDVRKIAMLARIALSEDEAEKLGPQLARILDYVRKLEELDTEGVEPTAHPHDFACPLRADIVTNANAREQLLAVAPVAEDGFYIVPRVVE